MHACVSVMAFSPSFTSLCISLLLCCTANTKVYNRCELARELVEVHEIPANQVATWVCIAYRESTLNTSAVNRGSGDHGLFQISERWWCSPPGEGYACAIPCAALEDDDIEDDVVCARRVFRAHQRISGDGFSAWAVYPHFCKDKEKVKKYVEGCFDDGVKNISENLSITEWAKSTPATTTTAKPSKILKESPIVAYRYVSTGLIKGVSPVTAIKTTSGDNNPVDVSRNVIKPVVKESEGVEKRNRKSAYSIFITSNGFRLTRSDNSK